MYWLQTFTGKKIDLINPTSEMVDIEDIAHSLSMLCRYNGHCRDFYSVAEHSVFVESLGRLAVEPQCSFLGFEEVQKRCLSLLLHDAAETYIGDLTTPFKQGLDAVGDDSFDSLNDSRLSKWKITMLEKRWLGAIGIAFGLGGERLAESSDVVRQADDKALAMEVPVLFHPVQSCWWEKRNRPRSGGMTIHCWSPAEARRRFIDRFRELYETLHPDVDGGWCEAGET